MSLTSCLKKAGDAIHADDKAAIIDRARALRGLGMPTKAASVQAVEERIAEVRALVAAARATEREAQPERDTAEPLAHNVVQEPDAPYETDLFGDPVPQAARKATARPGQARNVQPAAAVPGDTPAPAGEYAVRTVVGRQVERELGASRIRSAADAAAATRYLYRSAVERVDGIVVDKDGKPLAVVGGFKGAVNQAHIEQSTLIGELVRVPGAAGVWFSHNHPSGASALSRADELLFDGLSEYLRGSGIDALGLLAIGDGQYSARDARGHAETAAIPESKATAKVPVIERELLPAADALPLIDSPRAARDVAAGYYAKAKAPGLMLLDGQHFVAAWVPLPAETKGLLRGTGGLNAIYRAVSESNAAAVILVHGGELDAKLPGKFMTIGQNIAAALRKIDVRPLDQINASTGESVAERGGDVAVGPVFSRTKPAAERPLLEPQTEADLRAKAERETKAAADDTAEQKRLAEKAKGDAQRDEFVLTGSERASDANAAQPDLLPASGISDLGEKIGGARKDTAESTREDEAGNVALFSRADSPATEGTWQPTEEQSEKVQSLNTALVNYGLGESWRSAYEPAAVPDSLPGFRQAVQAAFRRDVQPVSPTSPGFNIFNGVYIPEAPNTVFVNVESKQGFVQVAFHELWHDLRRTRPDLHRWFRSVARPYWRDTEGFREKLNRLLQPGEQAYSDGQALEELEANFLGDSMADPKFLKKLADDSPSKFRALVNTILSWLDRVAAKLRAGLWSDAYVADVQALQEHLRSVLVAYAEGQPIPAGPKPDGRAAFFARAPATDTPAFRRWFGDSKVVDAQGKPLVVYHGTGQAMHGGAFSPDLAKSEGAGFYFSHSPLMKNPATNANDYAANRSGDSANVIPVFLRMTNPLVVGFTEPMPAGDKAISAWLDRMQKFNRSIDMTKERYYRNAIREAMAGGHDGVIVRNVEDVPNDAGRRFIDEADVYIAFRPEQIKSAIGNRGTFDPGNPDIRFSRAEPAATTTTVQTASGSMTTETRRSAWLDATNRIQFAPGQWLYSAIGRAASPLLTKLGLKAASPEMRRLLRQMKLDVAKAQETAGAVAKDMLALDLGEREMVSDIIEKELKAGIAPPEHAVRLAAVMNQAMGAQARELVRLGMLSEEAAKRWDGAYLPRFYESKLRPKVDAWADAVRKLIGRTPVMQGIKGKHLKGRGLYETIPSHELEKWQSMGWEVRDHEFDPQAPSPEVQVWRDFSREERDRMGEIRDAGFRFVMGYMQTQRDIAIGRMLEAIANDPNLSSRTQREGLVRVPDGTVEGTGAKKYGKLAGRFVPMEVLSQLSALDEAQSEAWQFYRKALGYWKMGKALALDTPLPTPAGWTTMGEVREGDVLFDENGKPCTVTYATGVQHERECFEVEFSDGAKIVADAEHLWFTLKQGVPGVRNTAEILRTLKYAEGRFNRHSVPVAGALQTLGKDLPLDPYYLGVWLGNGTSADTSVTSSEADSLEIMGLLRARGFGIGGIRKDQRGDIVTYTVGFADYRPRAQTLQPLMRSLGLIGHKHIPAEFLRASEAQRRELLCGLMDTDGSVDEAGQCEFNTVRPVLRDGVMELLRSLGYKPTCTTYEPRQDGHQSQHRIRFYANGDTPVFNLPRKAARMAPNPGKPQRSKTRQIIAIRPVPSVPVKCIQVDSESHLYLAGHAMVPTHNTSMNPVSHMNNVASNLSMAHFAGVSYHRADKYFGALRDFIKKPPMLQEAKDAGLFLGTMNAEELVKDLPKELQELVTKSESQALRGAKLTYDLMTFFLRKPLGAAYEAEDLFFRYLIYKDARQRGMEPQDAVDHAQRFIFTYDDLPKGARMIRDFGIPFFAYTYKAIPALLHTALTHPHRMLAPAAVLWGANALAYALATDDDDDWQEAVKKFVTDAEFRERVREKQKAEHEHLPPWMKGMTALLTPKAIRLGMDEVTELPLFIDVSRIIPGGDIFDVSPNAGGIPLPQPITPSHPLFSIAVAMIANKDLWTGKDLVLKDADTSAEAAEKRAAWLWKQVSPAVAIGNYHWERTLNALAQATGSEVRVTWPLPDDIAARIPEAVAKTYTGTTDRGGMPVQPGLAALQTVGIKVRPIDLNLAEKIDASNRQRLIRDIDAQLRTMRRLNGKRAVSDKALDEAIETANRKKDRLREGLTVDGNNRD